MHFFFENSLPDVYPREKEVRTRDDDDENENENDDDENENENDDVKRRGKTTFRWSSFVSRRLEEHACSSSVSVSSSSSSCSSGRRLQNVREGDIEGEFGGVHSRER